jgi:cytochrome b561
MSHPSRPQPNDYAVTQKILHWLMALLIIVDLVVAQKFGGVMEDWDRFQSRSDHAGVGMLVTLMLILRLYLRWRHGAPALPTAMPLWQQKIAFAAHGVLYALMGLLIASGIIAAGAANSVIEPFGLFALNDGVEGNFIGLRQVHEWATWALILVIGAHIIAALYHALWLRDDITQRMLRFWRSE